MSVASPYFLFPLFRLVCRSPPPSSWDVWTMGLFFSHQEKGGPTLSNSPWWMNLHEHNGRIISSRNLLNESNSIPGIILLNERKRPANNFSLFALSLQYVCGPPSLCLPKALTGGGWNSSRPTARLWERKNEWDEKRKREARKDKEV